MIGPVYCQKCKRANSATAKKCLWCGVTIEGGSTTGEIKATRVEIEYLSGVDGIVGPRNVVLKIDDKGLTVEGERAVRIGASSLLEARVVDASYTIEGKRGRASWKWWLMVGPFALLIPGKKKPDVTKNDYLLTIKYKSGEKPCSVVFRREDRLGQTMLEGLARIVTSLAQQSVSQQNLS